MKNQENFVLDQIKGKRLKMKWKVTVKLEQKTNDAINNKQKNC